MCYKLCLCGKVVPTVCQYSSNIESRLDVNVLFEYCLVFILTFIWSCQSKNALCALKQSIIISENLRILNKAMMFRAKMQFWCRCGSTQTGFAAAYWTEAWNQTALQYVPAAFHFSHGSTCLLPPAFIHSLPSLSESMPRPLGSYVLGKSISQTWTLKD